MAQKFRHIRDTSVAAFEKSQVHQKENAVEGRGGGKHGGGRAVYGGGSLFHTMFSFVSPIESTPTQNRPLAILIGNSQH